MSHRDLPRTDQVRPLMERPQRLLRPVFRTIFQRRWQVRVHGAEQVPARGAQIVASNHLGFIDGPLLGALHPRPVHAMTKEEMFVGATGGFLRLVGQIPINRRHSDPEAIKACVRVLRDERVVGIYPEGARGAGELARFRGGTAYLALVTGAPVIPLAIFGTRDPGGSSSSLPTKGAPIDLVYGAPIHIEPRAWPRTREHVAATSALLHEALRAHLDFAKQLTGRELPGPIPKAPIPATSGETP